MISAGSAFNCKLIEQVEESRGQEGGLAPAPGCAEPDHRHENYLVKPSIPGATDVKPYPELSPVKRVEE